MSGLGLDPDTLVDDASGYFAAVYFDERDSTGKAKILYVNRGTDDFLGTDGDDNVNQGLGKLTAQYETAIGNAKLLSDANLNRDITFLGHSLGGGLASAQAYVVGRPAIVINPAGLHANTVGVKFIDQDRANRLITRVVVTGEALNAANGNNVTFPSGRIVGFPSSFGTRVSVPGTFPTYRNGQHNAIDRKPTRFSIFERVVPSVELHSPSAAIRGLFHDYGLFGRRR